MCGKKRRWLSRVHGDSMLNVDGQFRSCESDSGARTSPATAAHDGPWCRRRRLCFGLSDRHVGGQLLSAKGRRIHTAGVGGGRHGGLPIPSSGALGWLCLRVVRQSHAIAVDCDGSCCPAGCICRVLRRRVALRSDLLVVEPRVTRRRFETCSGSRKTSEISRKTSEFLRIPLRQRRGTRTPREESRLARQHADQNIVPGVRSRGDAETAVDEQHREEHTGDEAEHEAEELPLVAVMPDVVGRGEQKTA